MKNTTNKKSQTEMIGLVIVVVIILIGVLFYIRFAILDQKPEVDKSLDLQRAIFIAGALSRVYICENITLQQAAYYCDTQAEICGQSACDIIKEKVPEIVKDALGGEFSISDKNNTGKVFSFNLNATRNSEILVKVGDCRFGTAGSYPFKEQGAEYSANYLICQ